MSVPFGLVFQWECNSRSAGKDCDIGVEKTNENNVSNDCGPLADNNHNNNGSCNNFVNVADDEADSMVKLAKISGSSSSWLQVGISSTAAEDEAATSAGIFPDGRSLGGHMRSHLLPLTIPARDGCSVTWVKERRQESASSATTEEKAEPDTGGEEEGEGRLQNYGMRENPKKSIPAANPEFRIEEYEEGSVSRLLQDRESETESSKNLSRRRSKRARRSFPLPQEKLGLQSEKLSEIKVGDLSEPVSSISEETSDEDVAFCLMLLSRDRWKYEAEMLKNRQDEKRYGDEDEEEDKNKKYEYYMSESENETEVKSNNGKNVERVRGKHRCETCNKHFRSYQALGGHRASHKKVRLGVQTVRVDREAKHEEYDNLRRCNNKVHECPFCYRVFASGQALGGHKRSHSGNSNYFVATTTRTTTIAQSCSVPEKGTIDLNLPATMDDEPSRVVFGDGVRDPSQGARGIVG